MDAWHIVLELWPLAAALAGWIVTTGRWLFGLTWRAKALEAQVELANIKLKELERKHEDESKDKWLAINGARADLTAIRGELGYISGSLDQMNKPATKRP